MVVKQPVNGMLRMGTNYLKENGRFDHFLIYSLLSIAVKQIGPGHSLCPKKQHSPEGLRTGGDGFRLHFERTGLCNRTVLEAPKVQTHTLHNSLL